MPEILAWAIINACPDFRVFDYRKIGWISPIPRNGFCEYRDNFLEALGLIGHREQLCKFWPRKGPVWDGLGVMKVENDCCFLLEAKSYPGEMRTRMQACDPRSIRLIQRSLAQVKHYLGAPEYADWTKPYYQFCNRVALLYFLNIIIQKPAYLALVNFVDDSTTGKPTSANQWETHYKGVYRDLGIGSESSLLDRILSVYTTARSW